MKKLILLILAVLFAASVGLAQLSNQFPPTPNNPSPSAGAGVTPGNAGNVPYSGAYGAHWSPTAANTPPVLYGGDVLGAHLGYGRGCVMCHAPHGGAAGNGITPVAAGTAYNGQVALWGQDLGPLYGKSVSFTGGTAFTLPAAGSVSDANINDGDVTILLCLSCHDGSTATVAMMQNKTVETLPVVGGTAPTLFATTPGNSALTYNNEHPVGISWSCTSNWDCTGGGNSMTPVTWASSVYMKQYMTNNTASFWNGPFPLASIARLGTVNGVTCTTCHNQHSMTVWSVGGSNYSTMFFLRGFYNPYTGGNNVAQFCRNCHGGESNEMNGLSNVPTT